MRKRRGARRRRTGTRQPGDQHGRADRFPGARGESTDCRRVTNANTCLRWLTRDHPDLEEAREAASRIVKDATRAAGIISRVRLLFRRVLRNGSWSM